MYLEKINKAEDIRKIRPKDYPALAREIREFLISKISVTGGHLASNLGTVELTMAIYLAFDLPKDKIVWDVGHQTYTHKILSGRKEGFDELRRFGGMSGFPQTRESEYDAFNTGHSSTSISAALGLAQARDLRGEDFNVAAVIGDGALTGGMAYEALNNASRMKKNFIIILNDNNMSISRNVGGVSQYLGGLRTAEGYVDLKKKVVDALEKMPSVGPAITEQLLKTKSSIKQLLIPGMLFEDMGITYLGPVDGHDVGKLVKTFNEAKKLDHAVLVHVLTRKGRGYAPAEKDPSRFHGVSAFDIKTGKPLRKKEYPDYTDVFSGKLCELAGKDKRIVAVTAAMADGTGLKRFSKEFPDRFFDVGIAEEHAVTMAAGMAAGGMVPVVAVYSSFLQRAFDQIIHDVCLQEHHVVLAVDRAGLVGADGETHQGIFDLSFLGLIPGMTIIAPKGAAELEQALEWAVNFDHPIAIRYPRGQAYRGLTEYAAPMEYGRAEMIYGESEIALLAAGSMVAEAETVRQRLKADGHSCTLVNMRFVKPVDLDMVDRIARDHRLIVTMEENVLRGGFGLEVADYLERNHPDVRICHVSIPDTYVEHGNVDTLKAALGIDPESIYEKVCGMIREMPVQRQQMRDAGSDLGEMQADAPCSAETEREE
jgi:1-deoxy-D-xylulose-5-phosphate synthase